MQGCLVPWTDLPRPYWKWLPGGLGLLSQGKVTFFHQRGESYMLSLEVPAFEQPEIA